MCAVNTWLATWLFDLGFESCNRDCLGSAVTDGMLAAHALWSAWRLRSWLARTRQQQVQREAITRAATQSHSTGPTGCSYATQPSMLLLTREDSRWSFGTLAVTLMATNGVWASVGASYWLQPGGQRWPTPEIFEVLWRINSLCQALLIYVAYLVALTIIRIGGVWPAVARHEPLLLRLALVHAAIFGLVCLWPGLCAQRDYVLWGGVNIMPPLLTQWGAIVTLVLRHRLHRSLESLAVPRRDGTVAFGLWLPRHALFGAAASGIWFWLGNSAIFLGRHQGLALWMRQAASRLLRLDPEGLDPECVPCPSPHSHAPRKQTRPRPSSPPGPLPFSPPLSRPTSSTLAPHLPRPRRRPTCHTSLAHACSCLLRACFVLLSGGVPPTAFEEMAVFHIFGIVGNELLFRAYGWIAMLEASLPLSPTPSRTPSPTSTPPLSSRRSTSPNAEEVDACPTTAEAVGTSWRPQSTTGRRSPPVVVIDESWLATMLAGSSATPKKAKSA